MIKRLIVDVSGMTVLKAKIEFAVDLAQRHGAEISLLSVVDVERLSLIGPVPIGAGKHAHDMRKARIEQSHKLDESAIADFEAACAAAEIPVRVIREEGDPLDVLADAWRYHDLFVIGARGWFDDDVVVQPRETLLKVIAHGVRPMCAVTEYMRPIRTALIAYNGSPGSANSMKRFIQMSLWPEVRVHIVCVGKPKSRETPQTVLDQAAAYCRQHGYDPVPAQIEGDVPSGLLDHAAAIEADMIVLGSSYFKVLWNERFGKNALGLIKRSEIPLFLSH